MSRCRFMTVAVILGDPDRPNSLLPDQLLGASGLAVEELKATLASLTQYRFFYLTAHATLIDDLRFRATEIDLVLNFCDEGFKNRAGHELHIPTLLEMLDLPYTGSGPQCRAQCYALA